MVHSDNRTRICGLIGGMLFWAQALYNIYTYILLFVRVGAAVNLLTVLSIVEYLMLGLAAVMDRRGTLLKIAACMLGVQNLFSAVTVLVSTATATAHTTAYTIMLTSAVGSIASVIMAAVILAGVRSQGQARGLNIWCAVPAVVQMAGIVLQLRLLTAREALSPAGLVLAALRCVGIVLVCLWATAPVRAGVEEELREEEFPFAESV